MLDCHCDGAKPFASGPCCCCCCCGCIVEGHACGPDSREGKEEEQRAAEWAAEAAEEEEEEDGGSMDNAPEPLIASSSCDVAMCTGEGGRLSCMHWLPGVPGAEMGVVEERRRGRLVDCSSQSDSSSTVHVGV